MRLVYKFNIGKNEEISKLCKVSNNLYNQALYVFRETLKNESKWLSYFELDKILKDTRNLDGEINYRLLKAQCSQQVLKLLDKNIKSYYESVRDYKRHPNKYKENQKFTQIPFARLVSYLEYKCELAGIEIVIHEESYTSKCDFIAFEKMGKHENYLGKRKKRGLFQSSVGKLINADVNGALNIMRK